jgi:hypothetical protein
MPLVVRRLPVPTCCTAAARSHLKELLSVAAPLRCRLGPGEMISRSGGMSRASSVSDAAMHAASSVYALVTPTWRVQLWGKGRLRVTALLGLAERRLKISEN